jgi:3-oxoacyl-[acyl-carrier protein] reductase
VARQLWRGGDATEFTIRQVDLGIAGKVALVTGGTRGIGLGIAQALAAEGVRVSVAARSESDVERIASSLKGAGVAADLLTEEGCERSVEATEKALGPIDILVNNLGSRAGSSWADTGPSEFVAAFEGNVGVSVRMTQLVLKGMLERGWGRIVVVTSVWGRESGGAPAYNAAKAAEISMVTSLARDVAANGVTVNAIAPGSILWEGGGWDRRQKSDPEGIAEFVRRDMPLGRFGSVDEVASVVAFLCSAQASLVNGACISVDGGQSRSNI